MQVWARGSFLLLVICMLGGCMAEEVVQLESVLSNAHALVSDSIDAPTMLHMCTHCHAKCASVHCTNWCDQNACNKGNVPPATSKNPPNRPEPAQQETPAETEADEAIKAAESVEKVRATTPSQQVPPASAKEEQKKAETATKAKEQVNESVKQLAAQKVERDAKKKADDASKGKSDVDAENGATDDNRKEQEAKKKDERVQTKKFNALMNEATQPAAVKDMLDGWKMVRKNGVQTAEPLDKETAKETAKKEATKPPNVTTESDATDPNEKESMGSDTTKAALAACKTCLETCETGRCKSWCNKSKLCTAAQATQSANPGASAQGPKHA